MSRTSEEHPAPSALFASFPPVPDAAWEEQIRQDLGEGFAEKLTWRAPTIGVDTYAYYRRGDVPRLAPLATAKTNDEANKGWRLRQDFFHPDLGKANRHARMALDGGATDLGLVLRAENGALRGLPLHTPGDLQHLLDGVSLEHTPLHLDAGQATPALLAMLLEEAARRGFDPGGLQGSAAYDPLATLARHGTLPADDAYERAARLARYAAAHLPHLRVLAADARPYHDAGASVVDELACVLAAASEHCAQLTERGAAPAAVARALHIIVPVGTSFWAEIGKLRALRLLWHQIAEAHLPDEASVPPARVHAVASRRQTTRYDAHTNLLRTTTEAAAAVLGGADVLSLLPYDAALGPPSDLSQRLARGTQLLLRHEAHLGRVADPAAGAYYIETLTDKLARAAWARFQEIEKAGGLLAALQSGVVQEQVAETRAQRAKAVAERRRVLVGTNSYPHAGDEALPAVEAAPAPAPLRTTDRAPSAGASLAELRQAFADGATLGDALAADDGATAITAEALPAFRAAEAFEALRLRTERHARAGGRRPTVFLLPFGPKGQRGAQANFARNLFGCAGFRIEEGAAGYDPPASGVEAARTAGADLVVLCSADDAYAEAGLALCQNLKALDPAPLVIVAGQPESADALRQAGADGFVHAGQNALETLLDYQQRLGAPLP